MRSWIRRTTIELCGSCCLDFLQGASLDDSVQCSVQENRPAFVALAQPTRFRALVAAGLLEITLYNPSLAAVLSWIFSNNLSTFIFLRQHVVHPFDLATPTISGKYTFNGSENVVFAPLPRGSLGSAQPQHCQSTHPEERRSSLMTFPLHSGRQSLQDQKDWPHQMMTTEPVRLGRAQWTTNTRSRTTVPKIPRPITFTLVEYHVRDDVQFNVP